MALCVVTYVYSMLRSLSFVFHAALAQKYYLLIFYAIVYIHAVMQGNSSKARVAVSRDHGPHCVTRKRCYIIVHWLAADNHCGVNFDIGDHTQPQVGYHKPGLWSSLLSLATRAVYCKEYVYTR